MFSWWQSGVIYQVYPRSFMDGNGDGVGDLAGIRQRLDYLSWLGIDTLWLSPIYPSPMADFGYDIADYTNIDAIFGSLADFDDVLRDVHQRNMKLVLDFVPNHTSDEHPWFHESRSGRESAKRDWYLWHDPAPDGGPPNNWTSFFGGSAWQLDAESGQYYLHMFDVKQPDLNWRNPRVRQAMYDVLRFWLERGVDGFRVDVIWMLIKDDLFRDNVERPHWKPGDPAYARQDGRYSENQPQVHDVIREMRSVTDEYSDRVLIGEIYLPLPQLMEYYGPNLDEVHLPFNFRFLELQAWNAQLLRQSVDEYEAALLANAWPNWVLGNHDRSRIASRIGREQARIAQMLLLTLRGTPTCYYGDELGLLDSRVPVDLIRDPQGKENPAHSRDPYRSPMPWHPGPNAGFSAPETKAALWLPLPDDYQSYNVASELTDTHSFLMFVKHLLTLRHAHPALSRGSYRSLEHVPSECFVYLRTYQQKRFLIALNCSAVEQSIHCPQEGTGHIILSTSLDRSEGTDLSPLHLRAHEGCILELDA